MMESLYSSRTWTIERNSESCKVSTSSGHPSTMVLPVWQCLMCGSHTPSHDSKKSLLKLLVKLIEMIQTPRGLTRSVQRWSIETLSLVLCNRFSTDVQISTTLPQMRTDRILAKHNLNMQTCPHTHEHAQSLNQRSTDRFKARFQYFASKVRPS